MPPDNARSSRPVDGQRNQAGQFAKGRSGNPAGRPVGSRNRATVAAQALLDGDAERLTQAAIAQALAGDSQAMRLCLERILPPVRERPIAGVELQSIHTSGEAAGALARLVELTAAGELLPTEAERLGAMLLGFIKAVEVGAVEERVEMLEQRLRSWRELP